MATKKTSARMAVVNPDGSERIVHDGGNHELRPISMADCPPHLDAEERARFEQIISTAPAGVLTNIDAVVVALHATNCLTYERVTAELRGEPMTVQGPNGMMRMNPLISAQSQAHRMMLDTAKVLGLTPKARNCVKADKKLRDQSINPFQTFK